MIHHPERDDDSKPRIADESDGLGRLPSFARHLPYVIESSKSPTRIEYILEVDGDQIAPDSIIQVRAETPGGKSSTVTYELETRELPAAVFTKISQTLRAAKSQGQDPHEVAKELYKITAQSGAHMWRTVERPPTIPVIGASRSLGLIIPPLRAYLRDPDSIGKQYSATWRFQQQRIAVTTQLDVKKNVVHVQVRRHPDDSSKFERYVIPGRLDPSIDCNAYDIESDLRVIALTTLGKFSEGGPKAFRDYMVAKVQEHFMSVHGSEQQTLTYTKRFPSNSSVSVKVRPNRAVVTISSGSLDRDTIRSNNTTAFRWHISGHDSYNQTPAVEILGEVLPVLGALQAGMPLTDAIDRLNVLAGSRQEILARATVQSILGIDVTEAVRAIRGVRVSRIPEGSLLLADRLADTLRGIDVVKVSTSSSRDLQDRPQVIREMEIGVTKGPCEEPTLRLVAWNQINNRIQAVFSPDTIQRYGGLKKTMVDLCDAMREQAEVSYPWQGRTRFLAILQELDRLGQGSSWLTEMGESKLPHIHDIHGHRMLDQVAAPLISMFNQLSKKPGITRLTRKSHDTESYVKSTAEKELQIVLGEPDQHYALDLHVKEWTLKRVRVVSRVTLPNEEQVLAWERAHKFAVRVPDVAGQGQQVVKELVRHFAALANRPGKTFEKSALRTFLEQLSAERPPQS